MLPPVDSIQKKHAEVSFSPGCGQWTVEGLTLGSALRPMQLPEREETFGAEALVASLCVLALLRTRAVNLALVHVCVRTSVTVSLGR